MVRLMLVLAPVMCILGGIAISASLSSYMKYLEGSGERSSSSKYLNFNAKALYLVLTDGVPK